MTAKGAHIGALVGPGRSGTTWAGTLIDSNPDVIYRFEPFHRMAAVSPEYHQWTQRLRNREVVRADLPQLYELLCKAHPLINKEPFFPKSYGLRTLGRRRLWPVARAFSPAASLYSATYSPRPGPPVVFKEVTFVKPLQNLVKETDMRIVYLVRHPCATVLSEVSGQRQGKMPSARQQGLQAVLMEHAPDLAERFADVCLGSDIVQRTALLWRCEVEACLRLVNESGNCTVVTYEQLTEDAYEHVRKIFGHLRLAYSDQTKELIDRYYALEAEDHDSPRRTGWGDSYFSVNRNPRKQRDAWKLQITAEDRRKIETIVDDSFAVSFCARLGGW